MKLALSANVEVFNVIPVAITVVLPVYSRAILATLTDSTATFLAEMVEKIIPILSIKLTHRAQLVET